MTEAALEAGTRRWVAAWLGGTGLAAALLVCFPLSTTDIWWHLASAREMLAAGDWLRADPFSLSAAGWAWDNVHWLFQLGAYALHALGGPLALVWAKAGLVGGGLSLLLLAVAERRGHRMMGLAALIGLVALIPVRQLVLARPIAVTLVLLSAFFWLLERYRRTGELRVLLPLPLLHILWANSQGLHPLGAVLVAAYALAAVVERVAAAKMAAPFGDGFGPHAARHLGLTFAAILLGGCITPYGLRAWALPFTLLGRIEPQLQNLYATNVSENLPPWLMWRLDASQASFVPLLVCAILLSFVWVRRALPLSHFFIACAFIGLGLMAQRNLLLTAWLGAPIVAMNLGAWLQPTATGARQRRRLQRLLLSRSLPAAGIAAALGLALLLLLHEPPLGQAAPFRVPQVATERLAQLPDGNVFASVRFGGYVSWARGQHNRPYIDGRLVLRTPEQLAEYLDLLDHPQRFDTFRQRWQLRYAVLPTAMPTRYLGLVAHLLAHPAWSLLATDGSSSLFAFEYETDDGGALDLSDPTTVDRLHAELLERWSDAPRVLPVARQHLALLLMAAQQAPHARRVLRDTLDPVSLSLVARCYYLEGDLHLAETVVRELLVIDADHVAGLTLLARVSIARGHITEALATLRRALDQAPYDAEALALLAQLESQLLPLTP